MYADPNEPSVLTYREFVPLDVGESKTYRIEVRAVNDGYGYVTGVGYGFSTARLSLYIDDEETLPYHEHRERYPAMHPVPERTPYAKSTELFPPLTDEERNAATEYVPPSRERLTDFFEAYFAGNDSKQDIGDAMDFVQQMGGHLNYTLTDIRQILGDAGYANDEIEAEWSTRSSSARSHVPFVVVSGQINIGQIPLGVGNTTFVNSAEACVNVTNRNTGNGIFLGCFNTNKRGVFLAISDDVSVIADNNVDIRTHIYSDGDHALVEGTDGNRYSKVDHTYSTADVSAYLVDVTVDSNDGGLQNALWIVDSISDAYDHFLTTA